MLVSADEILERRTMCRDGFVPFTRFTAMKTRIPKTKFAVLLSLITALSSGTAMAQLESSSTDPAMSDPVPGKGTQYPASAATADQAYGGQPRPAARNDCSETNPCAVTSSAPHKLGQLDDLSK
jgi:hypothetical protein